MIDEYVERGVERIVLDDLLAFGAPEEFEAGTRRGPRRRSRSARLRHRRPGDARRERRPPTVAELARRDLFWKVRADPRRADLELGTRAGVLPYFVPGRFAARSRGHRRRRAAPHVRVEQLPRSRRRPPR